MPEGMSSPSSFDGGVAPARLVTAVTLLTLHGDTYRLPFYLADVQPGSESFAEDRHRTPSDRTGFTMQRPPARVTTFAGTVKVGHKSKPLASSTGEPMLLCPASALLAGPFKCSVGPDGLVANEATLLRAANLPEHPELRRAIRWPGNVAQAL